MRSLACEMNCAYVCCMYVLHGLVWTGLFDLFSFTVDLFFAHLSVFLDSACAVTCVARVCISPYCKLLDNPILSHTPPLSVLSFLEQLGSSTALSQNYREQLKHLEKVCVDLSRSLSVTPTLL